MKVNNRLIFVVMLLLGTLAGHAQIRGVVTDSLTNEPLPYVNIYYEGQTTGCISDNYGHFTLQPLAGHNEITVSMMGYTTKKVKVNPAQRGRLRIQLVSADVVMKELVVKPKRERYRKKDNPAVIMMRKVIAAKKHNALDENDFYRYDRYEKITVSLNNMTPERLDNGFLGKLHFLKTQVEVDEKTNQLVVPLSVKEVATEELYSKKLNKKKSITKGATSAGIDELFHTGSDNMAILQDVFTPVDIYRNNVYMLRKQFVSPISDHAISFYKYYIMDTIYVEQDRCFHLSFVPQNSQDFGFTGHLYVLADSSYIVKRCTMQLPKHTGVNFVEGLAISQDYERQANGEMQVVSDDISTDLYLSFAPKQGVQVKRYSRYSNYSFEEIADEVFEDNRTKVTLKEAATQSDEFWAENRPMPLSEKEQNMQNFVKEVKNAPYMRVPLFIMRLFLENYLETTKDSVPSLVDVGPLSTIVSSNYVDGLRLRAGGVTTANLHPHIYANGYVAYGFKDAKWKYKGELQYSFRRLKYRPFEFPKNLLSVSYEREVETPMDKFLTMDKDNMFRSIRTNSAEQMSYIKRWRLKYELETRTGLSGKAELKITNDEPTGKLYYKVNDGAGWDEGTYVHDIQTTELAFGLRYAPGEQYKNSKSGRSLLNYNAPVLSVTHTMGLKDVFGGDYRYNYTEVSVFKRIWLSSWGKIDATLKAGAQWNKVPFPMLCMAPATQSLFMEDGMFNLLNNMELLTDRYAMLDLDYDMYGKLLNRIPLLRLLKWREHIGLKIMYGKLTDKNNPELNVGDSELFEFPWIDGHQGSFAMDSKKPYAELMLGIHNIFEIFQIDYVRRLGYLDNPDINKHGVRVGLKFTF